MLKSAGDLHPSHLTISHLVLTVASFIKNTKEAVVHVDRTKVLPLRRKLIPTFNINEQNFYLNGKAFCLRRKPLTERLLSAFLAAPGLPQSKNKLMDLIYFSYNPHKKSERFQKILRHNLNKLVSRARLQLDETYNKPEKWIDFLVYDAGLDGWSLYRLRNGYIAHHAGTLPIAKVGGRDARATEPDLLPGVDDQKAG